MERLTRKGFVDVVVGAALGTVARADSAESTASGSKLAFAAELPIKVDTDVFIAGGGPAGIAAAVAAARCGAHVFLAEGAGCFGGAATSAHVPSFAPFTDGVRDVCGGIGTELRKMVSKDVPFETEWACINMEELKNAADRLVSETGADFSFFTRVVAAVSEGGRIRHVVLSGKGGLFAARAKVFVDCTGDGDLLAYAGAKWLLGDETGAVQPPTLCSTWANVDFAHRGGSQQGDLPKAIDNGVFSVADYELSGIIDEMPAAKGVGVGNIGHCFGVNPIDERSLTAAVRDARRRLPEYERYYKTYLKGYEKMDLVSTAPQLGVRESRRIVCDYMLSVRDFEARASFPDEIGRCAYPVDQHPLVPGRAAFDAMQEDFLRKYRYKKGESYGIPYRTLLPKGIVNGLVAGRCIGTDRKMQGSVRVMPGCFVTGQAAGIAAALACGCDSDVRAVSTPALRAKIRSFGGYLPTCEA